MTQELEKTWAGKVLTAEELKQWSSFQCELESRSSEQAAFKNSWMALVEKINANLNNDPTSEMALSIAKQCMDMVNSLYGEKYKSLQHTVWEKGFKGGHVGTEHGLSEEAVAWLDKAVENYHGNRIASVLMQVGKVSDEVVLKQWNALLDDMCGKDISLRNEFIGNVINHPRCTQDMKNWLVKMKVKM